MTPSNVSHLDVIVVKNEMIRVEICHDVFLRNEQTLVSDVSLLQTEMKCSFSDFSMRMSLLRERVTLTCLSLLQDFQVTSLETEN
jgi:hypothetical protein